MIASSSTDSSTRLGYGLVFFAAAFWLSSSLLLDVLIMPCLYVTGMMQQADFGSAGYSLFWTFNRIELLCAALILSGLLALRWPRNRGQDHRVMVSTMRSRWALEAGLLLFGIALAYTYALTPTMGALGISLNAFQPQAVPTAMTGLHGLYWGLELVKLAAVGWLLQRDYGELTAAPKGS